jgi:hypothetical protein
MFKLLKRVTYKEMADNTYRRRDRSAVKFGKGSGGRDII